MKRVLIISYYFPPFNNIAALRLGKFAKFLPEYGWEPWVLTLQPHILSSLHDLAIEMDTKHIVTTGYWKPFNILRRLFRPTSSFKANQPTQISTSPTKPRFWQATVQKISETRWVPRTFPWYPQALKAGMELTSQVDFDIIFSSCGPPGSHMIASWIAHRKNITWVADYRDMWSFNHTYTTPKLWQFFEQRIEKLTLYPAKHITTVSSPIATRLAEMHHKPTTVITNGFDPSDYEQKVNILPNFTITYTGSLYANYDINSLFEAISLLKQTGWQPQQLKIRFYGLANSLKEAQSKTIALDIADYFDFAGFISHHESLKKQQESTVLLLFDFPNQADGVLTGKIFEYLGAGRPILAIGGAKNSTIENLLLETKAGVVLRTASEIKAQLLTWLQIFQQNNDIPFTPNVDAINNYSRQNQTRQLATIFENITTPICTSELTHANSPNLKQG